MLADHWITRPDVGMRALVSGHDPLELVVATAQAAVVAGECRQTRYRIVPDGVRTEWPAYRFADGSAVIIHPDGWRTVDLRPVGGSVQAWWDRVVQGHERSAEPLTADAVGRLALDIERAGPLPLLPQRH